MAFVTANRINHQKPVHFHAIISEVAVVPEIVAVVEV
jgi:hypothetical protein